MVAKVMTEEKWARAAKLRSEGVIYRVISEELGVSIGLLSQRLGERRYERPQAPTANATPEVAPE